MDHGLIVAFGYGLAAVAGLRITDIIWPPPSRLAPWWFYGLEMLAGILLVIAYR
jgi:hypothetical protein